MRGRLDEVGWGSGLLIWGWGGWTGIERCGLLGRLKVCRITRSLRKSGSAVIPVSQSLTSPPFPNSSHTLTLLTLNLSCSTLNPEHRLLLHPRRPQRSRRTRRSSSIPHLSRVQEDRGKVWRVRFGIDSDRVSGWIMQWMEGGVMVMGGLTC